MVFPFMRREGFVVKLFLAIVPAFQCTYLYIGNIDSTHYVGPCFLGPNFFPVVEARLVLGELSAEFDFQGLVAPHSAPKILWKTIYLSRCISVSKEKWL